MQLLLHPPLPLGTTTTCVLSPEGNVVFWGWGRVWKCIPTLVYRARIGARVLQQAGTVTKWTHSKHKMWSSRFGIETRELTTWVANCGSFTPRNWFEMHTPVPHFTLFQLGGTFLSLRATFPDGKPSGGHMPVVNGERSKTEQSSEHWGWLHNMGQVGLVSVWVRTALKC